jgi:hypothetical protein
MFVHGFLGGVQAPLLNAPRTADAYILFKRIGKISLINVLPSVGLLYVLCEKHTLKRKASFLMLKLTLFFHYYFKLLTCSIQFEII